MNTSAFISHRMFVAALSHDENGMAKSHRPERVIDVSSDGATANRAARAKNTAEPLPSAVTPHLLTTAISNRL
jgi:hypothetical protein